MKDVVQVSSSILPKVIQLFHLLFCLPNSLVAQVFDLFNLIYLIDLVFVTLLKSSEFFFKLVPFDLTSNLIIFHAIQNVLITLGAKRCVNFLIPHLLNKDLHFLDISFNVVTLVLDNFDFGRDEICFILESSLL